MMKQVSTYWFGLTVFALLSLSFGSSHLFAQVIDDEVSELGSLDETVVTTSTFEPTTTRAVPRPVVVNQTTTVATRTEKVIAEVPSAVGVITESEIARIAPLSFDDLIRKEPNVDTFGGPRYLGEQIVIRGQGGNSVTVRIDDARQNFVSGHAGQRFFVEPHFLKEVEILRGGGSYLYGSGAAGVVSISTLDPADIIKDGKSYGLRIRNEFHTNTEEWANSVIGAVSSENLDFMIGTSGRDANDITLPDGSELPGSAYERNSNIAKMVIRPGTDQQLTFSVSDYQSIDEGGANPAAFEIDDITTTGNNAPVGREIDYLQWVGNYQWNPIENDLIDLNATLYYNTTKQTRNYLAVTTDRNGNPDGNNGRTNVHDFSVFGIDLRNRSVIQFGNLEHELVYGLEYVHEDQDGQETRDQFFAGGITGTQAGIPGNSSGRPDADADHIAFFLTDEIDVTDNLTLFAGLRYDAYETNSTIGNSLSQSDGQLSPNIGFSLDLDQNWTLFGQYSRAFTQPTLNDIYVDGSHFGIVPQTGFNPGVPAAAFGQFISSIPLFLPSANPFFPVAPPAPDQVNVQERWFEEIFIPNPNLQPETADIFELGVSYENEDFNGGQLSARLTAFYQQGENTIDSEIVGSVTTNTSILGLPTSIPAVPPSFTGPGGFIFPTGGGFANDAQFRQDFRQAVNRAETEIYGAEFVLDYDRDEWFTSFSAGSLRGEDTTTGLKLNTTTGDQASLTFGIRPLENLELGTYGIWNGGREELVNDPNLKTAGYDIYGLFANWVITECWSLRIGVDNLLDQSHQRTDLLLPEPGRNVFFTSTIHW